MKQIIVEIFQALKASAEINSLVATDSNGIKQILQSYPPIVTVTPCVIMDGPYGNYGCADGKLACPDEIYTLHVFASTKTVVTNIEMVVNDVIYSLPYIVLAKHGPCPFEADTKLHHKILNYQIKS